MCWYSDDAYQVKLLLKLFICIVDTKLFEAVDVKCFKADRKKREKTNLGLHQLQYIRDHTEIVLYVYYP